MVKFPSEANMNSAFLNRNAGYPAVPCTAANKFEYDKFGTAAYPAVHGTAAHWTAALQECDTCDNNFNSKQVVLLVA
jgi:hypothetical protein